VIVRGRGLAIALLAGCGSAAMPVGVPRDAGGDAAPPADTAGPGSTPDTGLAPDLGSPADRFVGTWRYVSGTSNVQCPTVSANMTSQLQGTTAMLVHGVNGPLVLVDSSGCNFVLDVSTADTAVAAPFGQTCPTTIATDSGPLPTTKMLVSAVFTVAGLDAHFSWSLTFTLVANGAAIPCLETGSGDLLRISM
jgi:hypothetical protein